MSATAHSVELGPVTVFLGDKSGKYPDGNQVVVRGADTLAVFDTPIVANTLGREFTDADLVILGHVHEDHMAGLHRLPRARVLAHALDADAARSWDGLSRHYGYSAPVLADLKIRLDEQFHYQPRPDCEAYEDGARWDLGGGVSVQAFHMPGHTAGHCVLLVEPVGVAFIGDIDLTGFGPYYGDATSDLGAFRRTLARVADIPARTWVTSHHRGVITDRATFQSMLAAFAGKLDERDARLLAMLADGPLTVTEMVARRLMYPVGYQDLWVDEAEHRSIVRHLDELVAAQRVRVTGDGRFALA